MTFSMVVTSLALAVAGADARSFAEDKTRMASESSNSGNVGDNETTLVHSSSNIGQAARYRLIEGSTLMEDYTWCERPALLVPIRGSLWLGPARQDPLFSNYVVRCLRFTSLAPEMRYAGKLDGTYRIGGEFALVHQMMLEGSINEAEGLTFDSGLVLPSARFPWIEIDLPQVFADPCELPLPCGRYFRLHLVAVPWPAMWFSTEQGFHASSLCKADSNYVSDGDLLSASGRVIRTNNQLTARLGIMPVVPDIGLDAIMRPTVSLTSNWSYCRCGIWFSAEQDIFSETLGPLHHGDLFSDCGRIASKHTDLIRPFTPQPPVADYGLDAVTFGPEGSLLFSTQEGFFSESLGVAIGHGDLLCEAGRVFKTNAELMARFRPIEPVPKMFGLDAVYVWPHGEVWFSTEVEFADQHLGSIGHGDLLSDTGRVVARNLELVGPFRPVEDLADFGLDGLHVFWPSFAADLNFDGDVDMRDFSMFAKYWLKADSGECVEADLTGDGKVGLDDLAEFILGWPAGVK